MGTLAANVLLLSYVVHICSRGPRWGPLSPPTLREEEKPLYSSYQSDRRVKCLPDPGYADQLYECLQTAYNWKAMDRLNYSLVSNSATVISIYILEIMLQCLMPRCYWKTGWFIALTSLLTVLLSRGVSFDSHIYRVEFNISHGIGSWEFLL